MLTIEGTFLEPIDRFFERHGLYHIMIGGIIGGFVGLGLAGKIENKREHQESVHQEMRLEDFIGEDLTGAREIQVSHMTVTEKLWYRITTPSDSTYFIIYENGKLTAVSERDLERHVWPGSSERWGR